LSVRDLAATIALGRTMKRPQNLCSTLTSTSALVSPAALPAEWRVPGQRVCLGRLTAGEIPAGAGRVRCLAFLSILRRCLLNWE